MSTEYTCWLLDRQMDEQMTDRGVIPIWQSAYADNTKTVFILNISLSKGIFYIF